MLGNVRINLENCTFWMMENDGIKNCLRKLEKTRKLHPLDVKKC